MAELLFKKVRILRNHKNFKKVCDLLNYWLDLRGDHANEAKANAKLAWFLKLSDKELISFADQIAA